MIKEDRTANRLHVKSSTTASLKPSMGLSIKTMPGSVKQGYLHIKRERSSSAITSRVLFKSWQQAYFILREDPYILEEYKDASLKTQKQIHFIGTVKHVGMIRTSKSKQYAFEVVMREKTPLLLACDNEILLNEWITAFTDVMDIVHRVQMGGSYGTNNSLQRYGGSAFFTDTYEVKIIDTTLSKANNLSGEYLMTLSPTRILLTELEDYMEVLSWPLSHMSFYKSQPNQGKVLFAMGRNSHFGCGKLVFETKDCEQIEHFVNTHYSKLEKSRGTSSSFTSTSTNGSAGSENGSRSSPIAPHHLASSESSFELSLDKPVFDSPSQVRKSQSENSEEGFSNPEENNNEPSDSEEMHDKEDAIVGEVCVKNKIAYAEITTEETYVKPNEPEIDDAWKIKHPNFTRFSIQRTHVTAKSLNNCDDENESTSAYLQILEEEEYSEQTEEVSQYVEKTALSCNVIEEIPDEELESCKEENLPVKIHSSNKSNIEPVDEMQLLLKSITSSLEDPLHNENVLADFKSTSQSINYVTNHSEPRRLEPRRSSEPIKKMQATRSFEKEVSKMKLTRMKGSYSCDVAPGHIANHIRSSSSSFSEFPGIPRSSPTSSPGSFRRTQDGLPKKNSVSHNTHFNIAFSNSETHFKQSSSPFHNAEAFLSRPIPQSVQDLHNRKACSLGVRRNKTDPSLSSQQCPQLDRNTKPTSKSVNYGASSTHRILEKTDIPPPLPERTSPKNLRSPTKTLRRSEEIREDVEEMFFSSKNAESRRTSSSASQSERNVPVFTENGSLSPPPLPPKAKVLSLTRSAPLSSSMDENDAEEGKHSSSLNVSVPNNKLVDNPSMPPELPSRNNRPSLTKTFSSSESNILKMLEAPPKTPPKTPPRTPPRTPLLSPRSSELSKSLDGGQFKKQLSVIPSEPTIKKEDLARKQRSVTMSVEDVPIIKGHGARRATCPTLPKTLASLPSAKNFPKSPKKFF